MLALLLENVGTDKAVRIGNPGIWRAAVDGSRDEREGQDHEPPAPLLPEAERRVLEAALLSNAHAQHKALETLLDASSDHWGFEDPVYRFYHARFFLEMAVRYAKLETPPRPLPSGYAALLYLYQLR